MKLLVNASIIFLVLQPIVESEVDPMVDIVPIKKGKYVVDSFSFSFVCSIFFSKFITSQWIVVGNSNNEWQYF